MRLRFLFLNWWSLSASAAACVKDISPEICEESLTISSSVGSKRAELLSNYGRLSESELKEECGVFLCFVF